ncbi:MAG: PLP-dependent aminotransferase family protein [Blastocatellia bacterium]|nr:PLP-dependent aminotransferase family protein [Blastocatellia bacterium]
MDYSKFLSAEARAMKPNAIRALASLITRPGLTSFAGGVPSPETFPNDELADIAFRLIKDNGTVSLQYQPTRGNRNLIQFLVEYLRDKGMSDIAADQILLTGGAQQGLDLAARVLLNPGDVALAVIPSYIGGLAALNNAQARLVGVPEASDGLDLAALEATCQRLQAEGTPAKLLYTIPNFQNPSGVTLADAKRDKLVELAHQYDFLILEDDPYGELSFDEAAPAPASLRSRDRHGRVIYLGSFSKILSPGLRVGWMVAPAELAAQFERCLETAALCPSVLDQAIVAEACHSGLVLNRLPELRKFYGARCAAMLEALDKFATPDMTWTKPTGGLFIWLEAAPHVDAESLLPHMVEKGVAFVPGRPFCLDGSGKHTLRLAFSKETPAAITAGMETLLKGISALTSLAAQL